MADRREHVETVIRPALRQGRVVISDRYYFSSAAYQGALGLDPQWILTEHEAFALPPDLVIFLTLSPAKALARMHHPARQVSETPAYLEKVAAIYQTFRGPGLHQVDASGTVDETHARVLALVLEALADREPSRKEP